MNPPTDEDLAAWESAGIWQINELVQEVRRLRIWQEKASRIMDKASTAGAKLEAERDRYKRWAWAVYKLAAGKLPTDSPISPQAVMDIFDQQEKS